MSQNSSLNESKKASLTSTHPNHVSTQKRHRLKTQQGLKQSRVRILRPRRLAETKTMSQAEWLNVRKQGIGSSDCAAACGLNPYMSMLELWMIKTGRIQQKIEDESEGHAPLYWGKQLEPLVAQYYSMHTNHKVRRVYVNLDESDELGTFIFSTTGFNSIRTLAARLR